MQNYLKSIPKGFTQSHLPIYMRLKRTERILRMEPIKE